MADKNVANWVWKHSVTPMAFIDKEEKLVEVSPAFCSLTKYTESELLEKTLMDITDPRDATDDRVEVSKILAGQTKTFSIIKRCLPKIGPPILLEMTVVGYESGEGIAFLFCQMVRQDNNIVQQVKLVSDENDDLITTIRTLRKNWKWVLGILAVFFGAPAVLRLLEVLHLFVPSQP